jgi:APA family basic amino acid/polyamine antiporter
MNSALPRFLGPTGATLFIVCYTVGTAIFLVPGIVARNAGSIETSLALWAVGGLLTFCGALCYAELAVRVPRSGAEYHYMHAAYGPPLAFVFAWTSLFAQPVAIAAVARGFADYLAQLWPMEEAVRRAAGATAITLFAAISIGSTRVATRLAGFAAAGKLLTLLTLALVGIFMTPGAPTAAADPPGAWNLAQLGTAMVAIIWAFDGSSSIATIAGEVREPRRTLPISLIAAIGVVTFLYVTVNLVYFHVLGFGAVAASDAVASATLRAVIGPAGANVIAAMVMASALGTMAAQLVGNPRFFVGPAEDGLFPARLATISPLTLTPVNAILLAAAIAIALVALGGYELLIRLYVLSYYPLVVVALFAAMRLRRRDGKPREFAMPLYPLPLLVFGACIVGICVASAFDDPAGALFGLLIPLSGAAVYWLKCRRTASAAA